MNDTHNKGEKILFEVSMKFPNKFKNLNFQNIRNDNKKSLNYLQKRASRNLSLSSLKS